MSPTLLLAIIVLAPVALGLVLRVNGGVLFMSLCVGDVLARYIPRSAAQSLPHTAAVSVAVSGGWWQVLLLLAPMVLTAVVMFHSVKGLKQIINIVPALATGLTLALLLVPLLPASVAGSLTVVPLWQRFVREQTAVVGLAAFVSLLFLWYQHRSGSAKSDKKA